MQAPDHQKSSSSVAHAHKTILLAEDDPFISRMYQTKLSAAGYTVKLVTNGREAYEAYKEMHPSLALLDLNMPELTGLQVIKALQTDGETELDKHIMILTNSSHDADRGIADKVGIEYLVKAELTPREVLERIDKRLA